MEVKIIMSEKEYEDFKSSQVVDNEWKEKVVQKLQDKSTQTKGYVQGYYNQDIIEGYRYGIRDAIKLINEMED